MQIILDFWRKSTQFFITYYWLKRCIFAQKFDFYANMELQEQLKQEAIALGACEEGIANWGEPDLDELCRKYFKYQDFCVQHDWPSIEQIKQFGDVKVGTRGIYVNCNGDCPSKRDMAFLGNADMYVYVKCPCNITLRHNAKVNVILEVNELCYISMYDDCKLNVISKNPKGRIAVSYWSGEIENKELIDKIYNKTK